MPVRVTAIFNVRGHRLVLASPISSTISITGSRRENCSVKYDLLRPEFGAAISINLKYQMSGKQIPEG